MKTMLQCAVSHVFSMLRLSLASALEDSQPPQWVSGNSVLSHDCQSSCGPAGWRTSRGVEAAHSADHNAASTHRAEFVLPVDRTEFCMLSRIHSVSMWQWAHRICSGPLYERGACRREVVDRRVCVRARKWQFRMPAASCASDMRYV